MSKEIFFKEEGKAKMKSGIDETVDAIKGTMGAAGRNVFLWRQYGAPHNTNDGWSIAREINFIDPVKNMGAELVKEVAKKTVDEAGDGTSASSLLFQAIVSQGMNKIGAGVNVMNLKKGIDKAVIAVVSKLKSLSKKIDTDERRTQIATVSANNDRVIGEKISEVIKEIGTNGLITVESTTADYGVSVEYADGMQLGNGYASWEFINHPQKPVCELIDPYILVYDTVAKTTAAKDLLPICEEVIKRGGQLLIIANIEGEALKTLVINQKRGAITCCAVNAFNSDIMQDIAVVTGATYVTKSTNIKLDGVKLHHLGRAAKVVVTNNTTEIIDGQGKEEDIENRAKFIQTGMEQAVSDFDKNNLKERLAKLESGVAIIKVGGKTETEVSEKKDRIDDAKCATIAAEEEGYVAGGGTTFLHCLSAFNDLSFENKDEDIGAQIIRDAIQYPFAQILTNAGLIADDYLAKIAMQPYGTGVNVKTNTIENLFDSGVIDPTKVLRCSLENAASVAGLFLTTECVVAENI